MSMSINDPALVREQFREFRLWLEKQTVCAETSCPWPCGIGRVGRCKIGYRLDQRHGRYCTVRQIMQPGGEYGKPQHGVYRPYQGIAVVCGEMPRSGMTMGWLHVGRTGVTLTYPNYESDLRCDIPEGDAAVQEFTTEVNSLLPLLERLGGVTRSDLGQVHRNMLRG